MQAAAEEARFECARKLTELESRKRYEFLEAMTSSMDAHLRFYERGHEVCPLTPAFIAPSGCCTAGGKTILLSSLQSFKNLVF